MNIFKRLLAAALAILMLGAALALPALAENDETEAAAAAPAANAENVTATAEFSSGGAYAWGDVTDQSDATYIDFGVDHVWITAEKPVAGVYLKFYDKPSAWQITVGDETVECGQKGFLHEYAAIPEGARNAELRLTFPRGAAVTEIALYTEGALPDDVQVWEDALDGGADLVLFPTHSGDEHTFFGGVLPSAIAAGARCEVVYFCDHTDEPRRLHEMLDGLWAIGDKYYPVAGIFPNVYAETREQAEAAYAAKGYDEDSFIDWYVENIRRFRPQVLVIHDANGEDGEGANILSSVAAQNAIAAAGDKAAYPMSLASYGEWDTPKTYMHLCEANAITLDLDKPLDFYGGRTAYEMACVGFAAHKSQHYSARYEWLMGVDQVAAENEDAPRYTSATQIETYSPTMWGLLRTTVGADTSANMLENIVLYTRPGDEPRKAQESETETETEAAVTEWVAPATEAVEVEGEEDENPERDRLMKIVMIAAAAVVVGMVLALVLSGVKSRSDAKKKRQKEEERQARSEENARKLREARDERAKLDDAENAAEVRRVIEAQASRRDPSGKGAEREASIRAARAAREGGSTSHDKPTDKHY